MSSPTPVPTPILTPHQQAALQRRQELNVVKKQLVCIVVTISTLFALCPVWLQLYRNACVIALLGYLTSVTFDLMINLNEKWDNAPAVVKYFVPVRLPDIKPPSETVKGLVAKRVDISSEKLQYFFARVRSILRATVDWLFSSMGQGPSEGTSPGSQTKTPKAGPKRDHWVAVLVATPTPQEQEPEQEPNPFSFDTDTPIATTEICELISWDNTEVSSNLSIIESSTFKVEVALCLIPKSVWYSRKTLLEKFTTGLYWVHRPGHSHCQGEQWDEEKIKNISRVQFIGKVDDHKEINKVNERFDGLRKGWDDVNTYWSDVDYAIIFALLLVGPSSADICKKMFDHFAKLRIEHAQRYNDLNRSRAGAAILTLLTGGLAAPLTIPMMMGAGDAAMTMSANDSYLWGERMNMCKELLERYAELAAIIELKAPEVAPPKALFPPPPTIEQSWFSDDTW
ncbi:hypothetical protein FIE12Z_3672 [Fusarium flagelliforme]|uniref:Uncharacterized protein n=1 Tax=Fusarium flagelliforme TaxID=2675880 RepID=A0A395MWL2_9HYPO|nr:hypothetical protein FIE12Z_3672 [Fusarium flagelliforme]